MHVEAESVFPSTRLQPSRSSLLEPVNKMSALLPHRKHTRDSSSCPLCVTFIKLKRVRDRACIIPGTIVSSIGSWIIV